MKFKGDFKKIRFFATIGLSAMAMVVATIGTFAWFQAKSSGADPRHEVEAGSAGLDITSVSGYRGKYVDKGNGTDYTDAVVSHYDTNASSRAENVNADQMTEIDADTPSGGEGYYLVGDGNFCFDRDSSLVTAAKKEAAAYEYAYGVKMKTTNQGDNIAFIGNVYLNSSWLFDIRHHYYTSENNEPITKDDYPATGGASGDKVVASGGHFQSTETGWFDIYLNNSNQIYLRATGSANNIDPKVNVRGRVGPSIRKAAVTEGIIRVYFNFGSWSGTTSYARKGDSGDFSSVGHSTSGDSNYPAGSTSGTYFVWDFSWSGSEKHWFHYYFTDYGYNTNRKWHPYNGEQWATNEYGIVRSDVSNANYQAGCTYTVTIGSAAWEYGNHVENGFNYTCTQTGVFVHYDFNDGATSNENVEVSSSSAYTTRAAPTKAGYTFAGWLRSDTGTTVNAATNIGTITSPITFTAQWTAKQTTVTLNQQTGSGGSSSVTATYGQNMPSATMPTNSGYTFGGYWTAVAGGGTQYYTAGGASARTWNLEDATKTLYAKWTRTVTLNNQSATTAGSTSTTVTYNKAMTAITVPTKTGYTFQGYYTATGGGGTKYYNANGSSAKTWTEAGTVATLYAYWVGNSYTVTFAQEGYSTAGTASVSATYGSAMPSITRPSKTNYTFQGYYTQKYGKGTK